VEIGGLLNGEIVLLNAIRRTAAALGHLLVWCSLAAAQAAAQPSPEREKPPATAAAPSGVVRIEESQPAIYYLPDQRGNLQPVLDFKYQDFVELYKLKNQLGRGDRPPRYSLQRMLAQGTAGEKFAELAIQFLVLVRDDDWVRVPLGLDQGLLRAAPEYRGPGRLFVQCEGEGVGYVCWIRGKADARHEFTLTMLVPLERAGDETRLRLAAPRTAASEMRLTVPLAKAVAAVSEGAVLVRSAAAKGGATEFNAVGLASDFQLAWHKASPTTADAPAALEAVGAVLVRLDDRRVLTEATLTVRSYSGEFDRFAVRLPPETELQEGVAGNGSPSAPKGYVVTPIAGRTASPSVEVRLAKKTTGPVEVRLNCRRLYGPVKNPSWCELAGFEVAEAVRQWGTVAVAAGDRWQVAFGPHDETRPADSLPEALRKEDVVAAREYFSQPFSLPVRLTPRSTRVAVEPKHVRRNERPAAQATAVDRRWIQTWLTSDARQDRAVLQGTTEREELEVRLPAGAAAGRAVVLLHGRPVEPQVLGGNRLLVSLPKPDRGEGGRTARFVLELQYDFVGPRPAPGSLSLEFPRIEPDARIGRTYWQLVLPVNEHLIVNPDGLSGEFTWNWEGYFWGRRPLLDQAQLESWSAATRHDPLPRQASYYLFTAMGRIDRATVYTAGRTWIVLSASAAALVAGMLLIYIPRLRHPALLLALGIAVLAVGVIAPEPTLLLAQAAGLGLALALLTGLLDRGAARRLAARANSAAAHEPGSTRTVYQPPAAAKPSSTESLPNGLPPAGNLEP
jgi:hypothetical protein